MPRPSGSPIACAPIGRCVGPSCWPRAMPRRRCGCASIAGAPPPRNISQTLREAGIGARAEAAGAAGGACWIRPATCTNCRDSREGLVSVQDLGAQCVAFPLGLAPGQRVLDACAAPGGKTALIAEREPDLPKLVAVDIDPQRLDRVRENLSRGELERRADLRRRGAPAAWWDGVPFDRILLDAPCSALGVIRRHPDIRLRKSPSDIDKLPQLAGPAAECRVEHAGAGRPPGVRHLHRDSQRKSRPHRRVSARHSRRRQLFRRRHGKAGRISAKRMNSAGRFFPERRVPTASIMLP